VKVLSVFRLRLPSGCERAAAGDPNHRESDGTTKPTLLPRTRHGQETVRAYLRPRIGHLEVYDGVILWNDSRVQLNFQRKRFRGDELLRKAEKYLDGKFAAEAHRRRVAAIVALGQGRGANSNWTSTARRSRSALGITGIELAAQRRAFWTHFVHRKSRSRTRKLRRRGVGEITTRPSCE